MLLGISLNFLISCASVPAVPVCTEITPFKGWCTNTITDEEYYVDDEHKLFDMTWWELRPSMVMVPAQSWTQIKSSFIKLCKKNGNCNRDIDKWERKFELNRGKYDPSFQYR